MLGQPASSRTVCSPSRRTRDLSSVLPVRAQAGLDPVRLLLDGRLGVAHLEAEQLAPSGSTAVTALGPLGCSSVEQVLGRPDRPARPWPGWTSSVGRCRSTIGRRHPPTLVCPARPKATSPLHRGFHTARSGRTRTGRVAVEREAVHRDPARRGSRSCRAPAIRCPCGTPLRPDTRSA